jgi:hypothetical protein
MKLNYSAPAGPFLRHIRFRYARLVLGSLAAALAPLCHCSVNVPSMVLLWETGNTPAPVNGSNQAQAAEWIAKFPIKGI